MQVGYVVLYVNDAEACRTFFGRGVQATDVAEHPGTPSFAFADPEGHWFAVTA